MIVVSLDLDLSKFGTSMCVYEVKHDSEGSVGSASVLESAEAVDGFSMYGSNSDSRFAVGAGFVVGSDSENSEDRSSKSSTAASTLKVWCDQPPMLGHVRGGTNKPTTTGGKNLGISAQRFQQGKGKIDSSKEPKEERIKIKKEDSHSNLGSDSRSSNFVFMQGAAVSSNGKQIGMAMSYNGEHSDEAHVSEPQYTEEVETGNSKEKLGKVEWFSQESLPPNEPWGVEEAKKESNQLLGESMLILQSVQEALEKELQKFKEIGKDSLSLHGNSVGGSSIPADLTEHGNLEPNSSDQPGTPSEAQMLRLRQYVKNLEVELYETGAILKAKDFKISELEAIISTGKSQKEESDSTIGLPEVKCRERENEMECLFKQKIEAEVEYLAIARAVQKLKVVVGKQTLLLEEQAAVAEKQAQILNTFLETENKAVKLEKQAKEMEKHYGDSSKTTGEVLVTVGRVGKVACCFLLQLLLLILVLWSFVTEQLSSHSGLLVVVPT